MDLGREGAGAGAGGRAGDAVRLGGEAGPAHADGDAAGGDAGDHEGYRHFCQHFRPAGGRCGECDRCDLYRGEDEEEVVRRAGERAEREWRAREGLGEGVVGGVVGGKGVGVGGMRGMRGMGGSFLGMRKGGLGKKQWELQEGVDWWVGRVVRC